MFNKGLGLGLLAFLLFQSAVTENDPSFTTLEELKLEIVVHYQSSLDTNFEGFGLRGNGLGLNWDSSLTMEQDSSDSHIWRTTLTYRQVSQGFSPQDDPNTILANGQKLQVAVYQRSNGNKEVQMKNKLASISLPLSRTSLYYTTEIGYVPQIHLHPFFHQDKGQSVTYTLQSTAIGEREIVVYKPPGLLENAQESYKSSVLIDFGPTLISFIEDSLDTIFTSGQFPQMVIIGVGDWRAGTDRLNQLTPSEGDWFTCKEGDISNGCNGCVENMDELIYWLTEGGCGKTVKAGGNGEEMLDYILDEVIPFTNETLLEDHNAYLSASREDRGIVGMSMGGLFSCHAAWTHPEEFSFAGCSSSSFWWPFQYTPGTNVSEGRYLYNEVLMTSPSIVDGEARLPQRFAIDVAEGELNDMIEASTDVIEAMAKVNGYEENVNLFLEVYPDQDHDIRDFIARLGNVLGYLIRE